MAPTSMSPSASRALLGEQYHQLIDQRLGQQLHSESKSTAARLAIHKISHSGPPTPVSRAPSFSITSTTTAVSIANPSSSSSSSSTSSTLYYQANVSNSANNVGPIREDGAVQVEVDPYDVLAAALVPGALPSSEFRTEFKRFYILIVFSALALAQGWVWCSFSTVPQAFNNYFGFSSRQQIDLLLDWGPMFFIPGAIFASLLLYKPHGKGLRQAVIIASILTFSGSWLRCIPVLFGAAARTSSFYSLFCLHAGQILNAMALPFLQSSTSLLSLTWFAENERNTATAVAATSNSLGIALAYLILPLLVHKADDIALLLTLSAILASIPLILVCLFYPASPSKPPSAEAAARNKTRQKGLHVSILAGFWLAVGNRSFLFLVLASSLQAGAWLVWSTTLPQILQPESFSQSQSSSFASVTRFAGILGGFAAGWVADGTTFFQRRLKSLSSACLFFASIGFLMFLFANPSPFFSNNKAPLPQTYAFEFLSVSIAGFFLGAVSPLFFELSAEITYPSPEPFSAALLTITNNISTLVLYLTAPNFNLTYLNFIITCIVIISLLLVVFVKEEYRRQDAGILHKHHSAGVSAILDYYASQEDETSSLPVQSPSDSPKA